MKRTAILVLLLFAFAGTALAELHGSWTASTNESKPGRLHMNINRGVSHTFGSSFNVSDFAALSEGQLRSSMVSPVQFQLVREGGTVVFEGSFRNGDGAGQWTFNGNRNYIGAVRALGLAFDLDGDGEEADLFSATLLDLSTSYIKSMQAIGFRETLEQYLSMRIFNVTPELVRELRDLGFRDLSAEDLVSTRVHKVTPEYIRQMRTAGWNLSLEELMSSRIHQATPEFAEQMAKLGYRSLPFDDLVSFRIHRVTPELITELRDLGYTNVAADDLIAMRIHRVTPAYIRELKAAGYSKIPVEKLIDMKIHRIDAKFIDKMNDH